MQPVYIVHEPIPKILSAKDAACSYGFQTYPQGTACQGCSLFIPFWNLPLGNCRPGVQPVVMVSEPTSRGLLARVAACVYSIQTYLQDTVSLGCSLFTQFPNLPPGDCWQGLQPVFIASKPTSRALSVVVQPVYVFGTYIQGIVGQGCSLLIWFPNLPPETVRQGCSLFIQFPNQPPGDCWLGCILFLWFLNLPSGDCRMLWGGGGRDAACLYGF